MVATYLPRKVRVIQSATSDAAVKAIAEIKAGANFEAVAAKYSSSSYKGAEQLVTTQSTLYAAALEFATTRTVPGLTGSPIEDTANKVWYVVQLTQADPAKFKDEIITTLKNDTKFQEIAMVSYFKAGNFKVYDKTVYDEFKTNYAAYLNQK
jgi:parvulin-like peptidyl-prolyl isomerase